MEGQVEDDGTNRGRKESSALSGVKLGLTSRAQKETFERKRRHSTFSIKYEDCVGRASEKRDEPFSDPQSLPSSRKSDMWNDAFLDQFPPKPHSMIEIDLEDANGGPTARRLAHQQRAIPPKMP